MTIKQKLTDDHSFINDTKFRTKATLLIGKRFVGNLFSKIKKFKHQNKLINQTVISFSESDLWNPSDNNDNWILTAGKIENLRIASRMLNGLEIGANEVFSFWKHIGNPNFGKGYVTGREIREGCIIPTKAGGLCQLSNALYDAAVKANFTIIERHKHTKVIKGSLAEQDRDATVKWNYVDLRFKSSYNFRIEIIMNSDQLLVAFKSISKNQNSYNCETNIRNTNKLNDCYSCGNFSCFKHPHKKSKIQETDKTTFILDEKWPEFDQYIKSVSNDNDYFIIPVKKSRFIKTDRFNWSVSTTNKIKETKKEAIWRAIKLRLVPKSKNNVFELLLSLDKNIAKRTSRLIPLHSTHVIVSQNLLPFLFETGALGGRTFDVLMTRLPIEKIHQRLNTAYNNHSDSPTLNDFRAPESLIALENRALTQARKIITPHNEIAEIFNNKSVFLRWNVPKTETGKNSGKHILFPASPLGRKGGYEIRKLAKELSLTIMIAGNSIENDSFFNGVNTTIFNGDFNKIGLIVYPTYIEHQPRLILKGISKKIPVITTTACGIKESNSIKVIPVGDYESLKTEVKKLI